MASCSCHLVILDMNRTSPIVQTVTRKRLPFELHRFREPGNFLGFMTKWRSHERRRLNLVVTAGAELSNPFSVNIGLDSQTYQSHNLTQLPWVGPLPGDIAEVEAYCRIFRAAERLHNALMDTLCNPVTGECSVSYAFPSEDKPLLEDKIVSVLGCMICLLNKGREDLLSGRSTIMKSFSASNVDIMEDKLPPLALFRREMKRYCESLHVALEIFLTPDDVRSLDVWRKLQRLKNVCYDSGLPRGDEYPPQSLFANWNPVYLSTSKEDIEPTDSEVAFWRGSQLTEESLKWLVERGFKTIVDLRAETVNDIFYETALKDAVSSGKIGLLKLPVEVGTAPAMGQVEIFSALMSDSTKKPIYLHSKEGVWRTSAMVSRWRQYMSREQLQLSSISKVDIAVEEDNEDSPTTVNQYKSSNGAYKGIDTQVLNEIDNDQDGSSVGFCISPMESQLPPCNLFSRKDMSMFFRNKTLSPTTYFTFERKRLEKQARSRKKHNYNESFLRIKNPDSGFVETERSNGSVTYTNLSTYSGNSVGQNHHNSLPAPSSLEEFNDADRHATSKVGAHVTGTDSLGVVSEILSNGKPVKSSTNEDVELIEGNMCASTTGVVRVQSRKKAEMFLVRTDGFSCTREKVTESSLAFTHPSTQQQMLMWKSSPKTVLLLKKLGQELMEQAKEAASFLYHQENMNVLVEPEVHDVFARIPGFGYVQTFYSQDTSDLHERVDLIACLGGDGVILHASNLFRGAVPPVVSFNLGSLGFLTSHAFEDFKQDLKRVIHGNNTLEGVYITLRMRLRCEIFRNGKAMPGKIFDVLNEVVVDRGSNPYLSKIECFEHDRLITKVQGDGVIVATPTGSTAYSTAAGGSMVHPNVPCMLFTPICPHSLSFRPVILPDSARLELKIPEDARSNAWVSFDGKRRQQLSRGDSVRICMSQHPLPTVNKFDQTGDWFRSLIRCLNWNERLDQKAL
ncbi:NAD kinase 2, chloroplastic [Cynara cardunculus var. scolymus]|uniref:NAD(+) kinase n=1 Tax=Cynara cardunculus var. scolymus TaxID=59895 RepID=A0A103T9T1_CYNCS|nr:NAD kinase 2, chloroplastic [Cynara cardunculus var. scolymus]KVH11580.1 ATP-NAD kinase-like domain-containing protein [Cynara cardunculus var. scolymus]